MRITTNNIPRLILDANQLTIKEREDLDYLDWPALDNGTDSGSFFRYRGNIYDMGGLEWTKGMHMPEETMSTLKGWDGYMSDTYFSGIVIKFVPSDNDYIIVGRFFNG